MKPASDEILRYATAGIINTLVGYGVFLLALRWIDLSPELSNVIGYGVGLCIAFTLNCLFVFKNAQLSIGAGIRFAIGFVFAFALNQAMLFYMMNACKVIPEIAQIFAMTTYTLVFYLINKYLVWN